MATNTSDFFTFSKTAGTAKNLQKPTDGGDNNLWGGYINVDLDTIVGAVNATSDLIADANQNELVDFTATTDAVNHVGIANAAAGNGPTISAAGSESDVDLNVTAKGTGDINLTPGTNGDVNIPASKGITFGDDGEKIEGDGTNLTIASSANLNVNTGSASGNDLKVNTSQLVVEGDTGNVGIGTTSPSASAITGPLLQVGSTSDANSGISLQDNDANGPWVLRSNLQLEFLDDTDRRMYIDDSGNVTVDSGNVVIGTAGQGIDFDGNSRTAVFDDYEEGTFTCYPSIDGSGVPTSLTGDGTAQYVKIGRLVCINVQRRVQPSDDAGNVTIAGSLPFTPKNGFVILASSRALGFSSTAFIKVNSGDTTMYTRTSYNNDYNETNNEGTTGDTRIFKVIEFSASYYTDS